MELLTLILLTLWTLWTTTGGEWSPPVSSHVSCVFMETCLLPCSFKPGDLVIDWSKGRMTVHIFDQGKDELKDQDASFRGRTSLFPEQFFVGNTSMQLFKVTVDDEGIYQCFVYDRKTDHGTDEYIHLRVEGPVKALSMEQKGDVLVCSSEGIYPQPNVSWAPPSPHKTQIGPMTDRRFSVTSSLSLDVQPPQQYSCNISTDHSWKSATYSLQPPVEISTNITIPCVDSMVPEKSLVWTFNYIQTIQLIVVRSGAEVTYTAPWRPFVEGVSERGSLSLKELSQEQEGVYVCELHTDDTTYISRTVLGHTAPGEAHSPC
uniref:Ig-like domain-containing protein n=2 Tax=Neogobius melanostomus TaxID=47308 RepID=A0A8C6T2Q6_9GOBI